MRSRLIKSLGSWHFEPLKLPEEEVLACTFILFESLFRKEGMQGDAGVSLGTLSAPRLICTFRDLRSPNPHQPKSPRSCSICVRHIAVQIGITTSNTPWTSSRPRTSFCILPVRFRRYRYCSPRGRMDDYGNRTRAYNARMPLLSRIWTSSRSTSQLSVMTSATQDSPMPSWYVDCL